MCDLDSTAKSPRSTPHLHPTQLISFFSLNGTNSLTKACYLIKEGAMGFDGILTSVFFPWKLVLTQI